MRPIRTPPEQLELNLGPGDDPDDGGEGPDDDDDDDDEFADRDQWWNRADDIV